MADWSALTGGYMQGRDSTLKARRQRQMEQYNDLVLKESARESLKRDIGGERSARAIEAQYGGKMPRFSYRGIKDPVGPRFMKWAAGKMGFKGQEQALPFGSTPDFSNMQLGPEDAPSAVMGASSVVSPMAVPESELGGDPEQSEQPLYEADGGYLRMADGLTPAEALAQFQEERRSGKSFNTEIPRETPRSAMGESDIPIEERATGVDDRMTEAQRNAAEKANKAEYRRAQWERGKANVGEGVGKARRAVNPTGAMRWALPVAAGLYGLKKQAEPDAAERGEKRFGWEGPTPEEGEASFGGYMKFLAKQGLLFASDVGDFLTGGLASSLLYRDDEGNTGKRQALPDNKPLIRNPSARTPANTPGSPQSPMEPSTPSSVRPSEPPNPMVDFGKVKISAKDIPNFTTQDWANFRMEAKMQAALSGLDPASMEEQVQDQITNMQMKGFSSYGHQGLLLQQAGDREGAMAAYRAAFQYLPNGVDIEFGTGTNNKDGREYILGFAVDEKTHQPIPGSAMVMTPDHVATMLDSMKDDKAWSEHVKDVRDYRLKERDTESMMQYRADTGDAALERAYKLGQGGSAGAAGMKPSDIRGTSALLNNNPYIQQLQLSDMNLAMTVKSLAARIIRLTGGDPDTVVLSLKNAYDTKTLPQYLASVGLTQQDLAAVQQEAQSAAASGPPQQSGPVTPRAGPPTITNPHTAPSGNPAIPDNADDADEGLLQAPRPTGRRRTPNEWMEDQGRPMATQDLIEPSYSGQNDNAPAITMQEYMRTHNGLTPDQYRASMSRPAP